MAIDLLPPPADRTVTGVVLLNATESRIRDLWRYRQWYRRQVNSAHWSPLRIENDHELRSLVKLLRTARQLAAPAIERADPLTAAKADADLAAGDFYAGMDHLPSSQAWAGR